MHFLYQLVAAIPALIAGLTVGHVVGSLHAPDPWPLITAIAVTLLDTYVLDSLIDPIRVYRAARRG